MSNINGELHIICQRLPCSVERLECHIHVLKCIQMILWKVKKYMLNKKLKKYDQWMPYLTLCKKAALKFLLLWN